MTRHAFTAYPTSATARGRAAISGLLQAAFRKLVEWQCTMRERALLAELSDDALKDAGLSQADIQDELQKPVWRR